MTRANSAKASVADWSRDIDPDAVRVVKKLQTAGFEAYLVGGCVRDLYLRRRPKDFDVATNATPEEIRRLFRNSRIIGRRFTIVHVYFGSKIIETTTFRSEPTTSDSDGDNLIVQDNRWGSIDDDAKRRDFTINALFLDPETNSLVDLVDGIRDLERGVIRTIGEAKLRFQEDPVRMIRAIKFAARLDFVIDASAWQALVEVAPDIARCSRARVLEEIYKLLRSGAAARSFQLMEKTGLLAHLWPAYLELFKSQGGLMRKPGLSSGNEPAAQFWRYLDVLDSFVLETAQVPDNGVLVAALFAPLITTEEYHLAPGPFMERLSDKMKGPSITLGMARRDRELAQDLLETYRRSLFAGTDGGRYGYVPRRYFHDALTFLGFAVSVRADYGHELAEWHRLSTRKGTTHGAAAGTGDANSSLRRKRNRRKSRRGPRS